MTDPPIMSINSPSNKSLSNGERRPGKISTINMPIFKNTNDW